mmetsp:Transcript_12173/g.26644  ORF Transcript_12173/g.26644 Transcript_12173/m.26644 type:complete len:86 (-) Transcript_12173:143-400(-)
MFRFPLGIVIGDRYDDCDYGEAVLAVGLIDQFGRGNCPSGKSSVAFGAANTASGKHSTVTGGSINHASGQDSSVSGGAYNAASGT